MQSGAKTQSITDWQKPGGFAELDRPRRHTEELHMHQANLFGNQVKLTSMWRERRQVYAKQRIPSFTLTYRISAVFSKLSGD